MREPLANSVNGSVPVLMFRVSSALRFPRSKPANATTPPAISTDPRRGASDPLQICASAAAGHADTSSKTAGTRAQARILGALRLHFDFDVAGAAAFRHDHDPLVELDPKVDVDSQGEIEEAFDIGV